MGKYGRLIGNRILRRRPDPNSLAEIAIGHEFTPTAGNALFKSFLQLKSGHDTCLPMVAASPQHGLRCSFEICGRPKASIAGVAGHEEPRPLSRSVKDKRRFFRDHHSSWSDDGPRASACLAGKPKIRSAVVGARSALQRRAGAACTGTAQARCGNSVGASTILRSRVVATNIRHTAEKLRYFNALTRPSMPQLHPDPDTTAGRAVAPPAAPPQSAEP
jgi:hypothetical protein